MARCDRVAEAIKKEVSLIIHDKLKDPRLGFVTITRVELTQDLRFAKIFFSVLGKEEDYKKTKAALVSALGLVRSLVARRLNLRFAPEIAFKEDRSSEYSVRIEEILNEINPARTKASETTVSPMAGTSNGVKEKDGHKRVRRLHKKK